MTLFDKEWQDYKDSKTLYKLKVLAIFVLLANIGWHIYAHIMTALESGISMNYIYITELSISWKDILYVFNCTSLLIFLPIVILSNVGAVAKTKMKNSHFFATGVSKESMGMVKISLSVFIPIIFYAFTALAVCIIANFIIVNTSYQIDNYNLEMTLLELYLRPFAQLPFMMMCISIALLAEQIGKDKMVSIFTFFTGFAILFALLGLSSMMREGFAEVFNVILFRNPTINPQKFILGELLFSCIFIIAFTLSVMRYAKETRA